MAGKTLLIFDYGGTLVDLKAISFGALNAALAGSGLPPLRSEQEFTSLFESNFFEGLKERYPRLKTDGVLFKRFVSGFNANQRELEGKVGIFPGIYSAVCQLYRKGAVLAIVTSSPARNVERVLERERILPFFSDIMGSETSGSKREKIRALMGKHLVMEKNIYYIGDTVGDVLEAKACGLKTVGVLWGYHKEEQFKRAAAAPDLLVDKPEELVRFLV